MLRVQQRVKNNDGIIISLLFVMSVLICMVVRVVSFVCQGGEKFASSRRTEMEDKRKKERDVDGKV